MDAPSLLSAQEEAQLRREFTTINWGAIGRQRLIISNLQRQLTVTAKKVDCDADLAEIHRLRDGTRGDHELTLQQRRRELIRITRANVEVSLNFFEINLSVIEAKMRLSTLFDIWYDLPDDEDDEE